MNKKLTYQKYINSDRLTLLMDTIFELEDEFKVCRSTKQFDKAVLIESELGDLYRLLMHETRRGLSSIQVSAKTVKVIFNREKIIEQ